MERPNTSADLAEHTELWLGYDQLVVAFTEISAMLVYQPVWDRRIIQSYGSVPMGVQAVVLLADGRVLPARRALADLHARWIDWQRLSSSTPPNEPKSVEADDQ